MNTRLLAVVGLAFGLFTLAAGADDWPQWRGPHRDNKVVGFTAPASWPKELMKKWQVTVGLGDASPALVGDKIYVFTRQGGDEVIVCLDAGTGKQQWEDKYAATAVTGPGGGHPGPRSSPAVAQGKVCTLGVGGVLSCLDAESGKVVWRKDTKAHPQFFTASSPIIVDGMCIAFLGSKGKGDLSAYSLDSGEEKWKWTGDGPAYGSPVLMTVDGTKQLVTPSEKSLVGVNVADGKLLWQVPFASRYNSGTPIVDGHKVICSGAPAGTVAFKVEKSGSGFAANQLWKSNQAAGTYNTPVLKDGLLYGLSMGGGGGGGGGRGRGGAANFFCMSAENGNVLWTDKTPRGQCGEILDAGSVLVALTSDSNLVAFKPSNKEYMELAKIKVADSETWAYPIVAGNRLFVKDRDKLTLWTIE
jgi:outer membrane protein assembly factor BamB